jgi:hypothetical protein
MFSSIVSLSAALVDLTQAQTTSAPAARPSHADITFRCSARASPAAAAVMSAMSVVMGDGTHAGTCCVLHVTRHTSHLPTQRFARQCLACICVCVSHAFARLHHLLSTPPTHPLRLRLSSPCAPQRLHCHVSLRSHLPRVASQTRTYHALCYPHFTHASSSPQATLLPQRSTLPPQ